MRKLMLVLAFVLAACSSSADKSEAERAVTEFHALLDAGDGAAIYAAASEDLKKVSSQTEFVAFLKVVHTKLGNLQSLTPAGWNINYQPTGTFITLNYQTTYAGGKADEQFLYRIQDDKALLAGYHINSMALILK